ncbi:hypothetical protein BH10BAC2_BH10BAC2_02150 [soil metagenome]
MKFIIKALLIVVPTINSSAQVQHKINFTIEKVVCSSDEKNYKPCDSNSNNRFVIFDVDNDKWTLLLPKTREYKIIKGEHSEMDKDGLRHFTFQCVNEANDPCILIYVYGVNFYKLLIFEDTVDRMYTMRIFE